MIDPDHLLHPPPTHTDCTARRAHCTPSSLVHVHVLSSVALSPSLFLLVHFSRVSVLPPLPLSFLYCDRCLVRPLTLTPTLLPRPSLSWRIGARRILIPFTPILLESPKPLLETRETCVSTSLDHCMRGPQKVASAGCSLRTTVAWHLEGGSEY